MTDIVLIQPPIEDFYLTAKRTIPYGLASIAGALRGQGFRVSILDSLSTGKSRAIDWPDSMDFLRPFYGRPDYSPFALFHQFRRYGYSYDHIARLTKTLEPFLVGISSLFTAYSDCALKTAAAVKSALPQAHIVLGGHHPTALPETVLEHPAVDFVLRGDGEISLPMLAKALKAGTPIDTIPGLARRRAIHGPVINPPVVVQDLDSLPEPAFDLLAPAYYNRAGKAGTSVCATRGCPLHCSYCAVNARTHHGFRRRRVSCVVDELKAFGAGRSVGFIDFEDEHLTADRKWFLALLAAVRAAFAHDQPELRAMNGLYAPSLDNAMMAQMKASGFRALNLALITTSRSQLKRFRRPDVRRAVDRVLLQSGRLGLSAVVYMIIAGPEQQPGASLEDLLFLAGRRALAGVSVFYPAPGSEDYIWCADRGLLADQFGLMRATALPLVHRTNRVQTVTLLRLGRILNFMKQLLDDNRALPLPRGLQTDRFDGLDRQSVGMALSAAFLADGRIRGVDETGRVYEHLIDSDLTRGFVKGLRGVGIKGTR